MRICTFARTRDGKIWIVYSDNNHESSHKPKTMDLIPQEQWDSEFGGYDAEYICCTNVPYADIIVTDRNLSLVMI